MYFRFAVVALAVFLCPIFSTAQTSDSRCKWVREFNRPVHLDSLSVNAQSISFLGLDSVKYDYDYSRGTITIYSSNALDSLEICYQVFPFAFHQSYQNRSIAQYDSNALFKTTPHPKALIWDHREELFHSDQLYKSGSISRGVTFGNNQDVFVNSNLNLQLEGKLTDDINILATITDQNIPFQPEGNTQQIQDFDKVFIQLFNEHISLSVGDVVLRHQGALKSESYFLQYYKNVQGGLVETNYHMLKGRTKTSVGISVAKGKFASIQVEALEGVQGPYRLRGPNKERFITILANSEKVFLDGKLLKRGFNNHYTIDYNLGEITFTTGVLITKFSRIRVDFEFSDQNYSKNIITGRHQQKWGRTTLFMNAYQEKDNRNRPLAFSLGNEDLQALSEIGDDLDRAVISGVDSVGFDENLVQYKLVDTLNATGETVQILAYSTNPDSASYRASFTEVGLNQGQYQAVSSTINGRVFTWVGVDSLGIPLGSFEPVIKIATPQEKRMFTAGLTHDLNQTDYIYTEAAFSGLDLNLYSTLDDQDNQGQAFRVGFVSQDRPVFKNLKLNSRVDYEFTSQNFSAIDRFRYIEFDRDWSASTNDLAKNDRDHIFSVQLGLAQNAQNQLKYRLVRRNRGDVVDGYQHQLDFNKQWGPLELTSSWFQMNNTQSASRSTWKRFSLDTRISNKVLIPGYQFQIDRNEISALDSDSVMATAMNFQSHLFYLQSPDTARVQFRLDYDLREDRLPLAGALVDNNRSQTARLHLSTGIADNQQLKLQFTYRNLEDLRSPDPSANEETINTRLDWQGSFLDRHIVSELNYQVGNSRELRREFIFLSVPTGEGTHTWRDENQDGIQDLNEFYLAINADERNYAKIFTPTDEYILAFANTFNYRLLIDMPRNWKTAEGIKKMLSRLSITTTWNIQNKLTDSDLGNRFSPFTRDIDNEDLIAFKEIFRTTGFYNRNHAKYGFDFGILLSANKQLLTEGFEARDLEEKHFNFRYSLASPLILQVFTNRKIRQSRSDFLDSRNFNIREQAWIPQLSWQPHTKLRVTAKYGHIQRENTFQEGEGEWSRINEYSLEVRQTKVQRSTLQAQLTFTDIQFQGEENTAVGYELLQALRPGKNLVWMANWQLKIASGIQLQLNYNGRKSADSEVVHTGRMQISALF